MIWRTMHFLRLLHIVLRNILSLQNDELLSPLFELLLVEAVDMVNLR